VFFSERCVLVKWDWIGSVTALPAPPVVVAIHVAAADSNKATGKAAENFDGLGSLRFGIGHHVKNNVGGELLKRFFRFGECVAVAVNVLRRIRKLRFRLASVKGGHFMALPNELAHDVRPNEAGSSDSENVHGRFRWMNLSNAL
jgi:hypothetical protein